MVELDSLDLFHKTANPLVKDSQDVVLRRTISHEVVLDVLFPQCHITLAIIIEVPSVKHFVQLILKVVEPVPQFLDFLRLSDDLLDSLLWQWVCELRTHL